MAVTDSHVYYLMHNSNFKKVICKIEYEFIGNLWLPKSLSGFHTCIFEPNTTSTEITIRMKLQIDSL